MDSPFHPAQLRTFEQVALQQLSAHLPHLADGLGDTDGPADWVLVCPPHLWDGRDHLLVPVAPEFAVQFGADPDQPVRIQLLHHPMAPPMSLVMVRSVAWYRRWLDQVHHEIGMHPRLSTPDTNSVTQALWNRSLFSHLALAVLDPDLSTN